MKIADVGYTDPDGKTTITYNEGYRFVGRLKDGIPTFGEIIAPEKTEPFHYGDIEGDILDYIAKYEESIKSK